MSPECEILDFYALQMSANVLICAVEEIITTEVDSATLQEETIIQEYFITRSYGDENEGSVFVVTVDAEGNITFEACALQVSVLLYG